MPLDRSVGNYFDSSGSFIRRVARWTGPNPYVTGGEKADASVFGMGKIVAIFFGNDRRDRLSRAGLQPGDRQGDDLRSAGGAGSRGGRSLDLTTWSRSST